MSILQFTFRQALLLILFCCSEHGASIAYQVSGTFTGKNSDDIFFSDIDACGISYKMLVSMLQTSALQQLRWNLTSSSVSAKKMVTLIWLSSLIWRTLQTQ